MERHRDWKSKRQQSLPFSFRVATQRNYAASLIGGGAPACAREPQQVHAALERQ